MKKLTGIFSLTILVTAMVALAGCSSAPVSDTETPATDSLTSQIPTELPAASEGALAAADNSSLMGASDPSALGSPSAPNAVVADNSAPAKAQWHQSPVDLGASSSGRSH